MRAGRRGFVVAGVFQFRHVSQLCRTGQSLQKPGAALMRDGWRLINGFCSRSSRLLALGMTMVLSTSYLYCSGALWRRHLFLSQAADRHGRGLGCALIGSLDVPSTLLRRLAYPLLAVTLHCFDSGSDSGDRRYARRRAALADVPRLSPFNRRSWQSWPWFFIWPIPWRESKKDQDLLRWCFAASDCRRRCSRLSSVATGFRHRVDSDSRALSACCSSAARASRIS